MWTFSAFVLTTLLLFTSIGANSIRRLNEPQNARRLGALCGNIAHQFSQDLTCDCAWNGLRARSVGFGCTYSKVCLVENLVCGTPVYNGTLTFLPKSMHSDVCVYLDPLNYTLPNITLPSWLSNYTLPQLPQLPPKICMSLDQCSSSLSTICSCQASMGNTTCQSCTVCPDGRSVSVDCTNVNPSANVTCLGI